MRADAGNNIYSAGGSAFRSGTPTALPSPFIAREGFDVEARR